MMTRLLAFSLFWICCGALVYPEMTDAQTPPGAPTRLVDLRNRLSLISQNAPEGKLSVADDMKLSKDQRAQLASVRDELILFYEESKKERGVEVRRQRQTEFATKFEDRVAAILDVAQRKRLDELDLQQAGALAIEQPAVVRKLELTPAQLVRIRDAQSDRRATRDGLLGLIEFGYACHAILTEKQRETWNEMIGEPLASLDHMAPVVAGPVNPVKPRAQPSTYENELYVPFPTLKHPVIATELQLTKEQLAKLKETYAKLDDIYTNRDPNQTPEQRDEESRKSVQARRAYMTRLTEVLTETQQVRLRQINRQFRGEYVMLQRDFREAAKLTDEQIDSLSRLMETRRKDPAANPRTAGAREAAQHHQETVRQALKLLSDEQRDVWNKMTGKPIAMEELWQRSGASN